MLVYPGNISMQTIAFIANCAEHINGSTILLMETLRHYFDTGWAAAVVSNSIIACKVQATYPSPILTLSTVQERLDPETNMDPLVEMPL
jgi:hypothetical protein